MRSLQVHRLGLVEYRDGVRLMELAAARLRPGDPPGTDYLFLLEHPPVVTLGRSARRQNLLASPAWLEARGFEVHETDRGGDVTYHGPGQVVAYPVLDLADRPDVRRFVAALEEAMIRTCADFGVEASRHPEHRGAWVGPRKIGALGVHFSRWVTSHGLAFNVDPDLSHFQAIVPCGIAEPGLGVTSLAAEMRARGVPDMRGTRDTRGVPDMGRGVPDMALQVVGRGGDTPGGVPGNVRPGNDAAAPGSGGAVPGGVPGIRVPSMAEVEERLATSLAQLLERERQDAPIGPRTISVIGVGEDNRVLLLRRSEERGGFWQPVTGRVEAGETPLGAAQRELAEETGALVPVEPLGYEHSFGLEPGISARLGGALVARETSFRARLPSTFEPRLSLEHAEWGWFGPEEAGERVRFAGLRKAVKLALAPNARAWS